MSAITAMTAIRHAIFFATILHNPVLRYISTRLLYMVPVIWLVVSVVFLLIHLVPGDPIQQMLGEGAASADVQAARHAYGLDVPLPQQYVNYWKGVLQETLAALSVSISRSQASFSSAIPRRCF